MKIVCDIFLYTFDTHGYTYFVVFTVAILLIAYLVVMLWLQNREKALLTRSLAHLASMKRHGVEYELVLQAMKLATWRIDLRDMTLTFENDLPTRSRNTYERGVETVDARRRGEDA